MRALALNCSLKRGTAQSSTDKLVGEVLDAMKEHGCQSDGPPVRVANLKIHPGVTSDEGDGDEWPELRRRILASNILVFGTPIWLGQPSSIAKRVLERMDAFLGETDDEGRMISFDRVAIVAVVGNEDGAHHVTAELYQALADVGFTIPAAGSTYWVGEAMQKTDYQDLGSTPDTTASATASAAANAVHLAELLQRAPYRPAKKS